MRKNFLLTVCMATCLLTLSVRMAAQQLSTTDGRHTYEMGETVSIKYEGAQAGDRIILYQNLSILPLAEKLNVEQQEGVYNVPPILQPGNYWALLVRGNNSMAQLNFQIAELPIDGKYRVMLLSDIHVMSPELVTDPNNASYQKMIGNDRKLLKYSYDIFKTYCDTIKALHPDLVLIPGDLTKDGELLSHQAVAEGLQQLLDEGIPSLVIPGNHDIESQMARAYDYDGVKMAETITIDQFAEIYRNFGYGEGMDRDPSSLSYVCEPIPGLVLIAIDDSRVPSKGIDRISDMEFGRITQATLDWVVEKADEARRQDKRVLAMVHHQMMEHFNGQTSFFGSSVTEHGDSIARIFAAHGIKAVFTGHMHIPNASKLWSVDGKDSIYDISSASTISYPSHYRMLLFDENLSTMKVVSRPVNATPLLSNLQSSARSQVAAALPETVSKLVYAYRSMLDNMMQQFAGIPEFDNVIADIPTDNDELAALAFEAFGATFEKVVFTTDEANENLKGAADEILEQLKADCVKACDLIFDNQNTDTRAFLATILQLTLMDRAEPVIKSMLNDVSFMGTPDENQTDDLYLTVDLSYGESGIPSVLPDNVQPAEMAVYTLSGIKVSTNMNHLPKGVYVVRQGNETWKIMIR